MDGIKVATEYREGETLLSASTRMSLAELNRSAETTQEQVQRVVAQMWFDLSYDLTK